MNAAAEPSMDQLNFSATIFQTRCLAESDSITSVAHDQDDRNNQSGFPNV